MRFETGVVETYLDFPSSAPFTAFAEPSTITHTEQKVAEDATGGLGN
jgi:hypothetical protein